MTIPLDLALLGCTLALIAGAVLGGIIGHGLRIPGRGEG